MEINRVIGTLDENGLKIRTFVLFNTMETPKTFKSPEGVILKSDLMQPRRIGKRARFHWETYCEKESMREARELIKKHVMDEYQAYKDEFLQIEASLTEITFSSPPDMVEADPKVSKFIKDYATVLYNDDKEAYSCLPFWLEHTGENKYLIHRLGRLPAELQLKMILWGDFSESHPELKVH